MSQTLPLGSSLEAQHAASKSVETTLLGVKGVKTVLVTIGSGGSSLRAAFSGGGSTTFSVTTDPAADQAALQNTITKKLKTITGEGDIKVQAAQGGFASSNIEVDITAGSDADLRKASDAILAKVDKLSRRLAGDQQPLGIPARTWPCRSTAPRRRPTG